MKCLACGSANLVEGKLQSQEGYAVNFQFGDESWFKRIMSFDTRGIRAYGCLHCQHLQLTVDFSDKDREEYVTFEGEHFNLLERINEES